jgi:hypothetical protein
VEDARVATSGRSAGDGISEPRIGFARQGVDKTAGENLLTGQRHIEKGPSPNHVRKIMLINRGI